MKIIAFILSIVALAITASADPAVSDALAKWRAAVHATGNTAIAKIESISNEDGIPGNIVEEINSAGGYHRIVKRDFDDSELVLSTKFAERLDWNGYLRKLEGKELSRWRTAAMESQWIVFGPPLNLTSAKIEKSEDGKFFILTYSPQGAEPLVWTIDSNTGLPVKCTRPGNDTDITRTYSDWRDAGGIIAPSKIHVAETEKPDYDLQIKSITHQTPSGNEFGHLHPGPPDVQISKTIPPIPFELESAHIVFKVQLNGSSPEWWLLDTGADQEVINEPRLRDFGIKTYATSVTTGGGNAAPYSYAASANFTLPGVEIKNQHVAVLDQGGLEAALGIKLGGILGYDFISRFVMEIDYQKKIIQLYDPKTWNYAGKGFIVPLLFDEGIPFANGSISVAKKTIPAFFVMDFGAAETATLTSAFVQEHDLLKLAQTNAAVNRPAGLEKQFFAQTNVRGHLDRLSIGNLNLESIPINLSRNTGGAYASKNFSGTVGEGIYQRYHVYMDYQRNRAIFEPTAEAQKPFPGRQTYGINVLASGSDLHTFTVAAVRPDSPAEKDGFQKGDVITKLDQKSASEFTLHELRDVLLKEGEKHEIEIVRGDKKLTMPITVHVISLDK